MDPMTTQTISYSFNKAMQATGWTDSPNGGRAVMWNNDAAHSIINLGVFGDDWTSEAYAINDIGQVVGESHPPASSRPVLWHNDAAHTAFKLSLFPGDNYGTARLINNSTTIVGTSAYAEPWTWNVTHSRMVIWINGEIYDLLSLIDQTTANGWSVVDISSMNNLGQMTATAMRDGMFKAVVLNPAP